MSTQPSLQMLLTYEQREPKREAEQLRLVRKLMSDGEWRTLGEIKAKLPAKYLETSISARLRELRSLGYTVDRKKVGQGLFSYRVTGGTKCTQ